MAPSTEARLVTSMRELLKAEGAYVNKNHGGPNSQGRPDLEGCYRGLHFVIEVKLPGKEKNLTKLQRKNLEAAKDAGSHAIVATARKQVTKLLQDIDRRLDE